jgi:hypothetical protein
MNRDVTDTAYRERYYSGEVAPHVSGLKSKRHARVEPGSIVLAKVLLQVAFQNSAAVAMNSGIEGSASEGEIEKVQGR